MRDIMNDWLKSLAAAALVLGAIGMPAAAVGQDSTDESTEATESAKGDMAPLEIELPKPMFQGTPKDLRVPNLERPTGQKRPPFMAPKGTRNLAEGVEVTSSDPAPIIGELNYVTDGEKKGADGYYVELGPGTQWVQLDLGEPVKIYAIVMWHYHSQARVYHDVIVKAADDADFIEGVETIFNNDIDNSAAQGAGRDRAYIENYEGKLIDANGIETQYLRFYTNGNTSNEMNHYVEIEVYGIPTSEL